MVHPYEAKDKFLSTLFYKLRPDWYAGCSTYLIGRLAGINAADAIVLVDLLKADGLVYCTEDNAAIFLTPQGVKYVLDRLTGKNFAVIKFITAELLPPATSTVFGYRYTYELEREKGGKEIKSIDVLVSILLSSLWQLDFETPHAENLLLLFAKDKIIEKIKEDTLMSYEEVILLTKDLPAKPPYPAEQYVDVKEALFEVQLDTKPLRDVINATTRATNIIETRDNINTLFNFREKDALLNMPQERNLLCFFKEVKSHDEFVSAIASLHSVAGGINVQKLRSLFGDPANSDASINVLQKYLTIQKMNCAELIKVLRAIGKIRKSFPIHTDSDIIRGCRDLGLAYPIDDYEMAWNSILDQYLAVLNQLKDFLKFRPESGS